MTIKQSTLDGIDRFVNQGIPTGDFLYGILSNDLRKACWHADEENAAAIYEIFNYCYNKIPSECWGSPEKYNNWIKMHRAKREEEHRRMDFEVR